PEAYTVYQNLLPRMGRGFVGRYVLLNRRRGIAMELHSRYDSKNERSERFLDWKVRRQRNHRVTPKGRESSLRLDAERWSPDETTLVLVGWKPTTKTVSRIPVPPIFSFTRATSSMGDEAPLLLMWPDRKDREAVRAYLEYILEHEGRGWDWLPQSELVIRAFAGVGRENLDLLVACGLSLPPDSNRNREVVSAIGRLAREEDRDLVCSALCPNLDLLSLILERGWEGHAREAILETALANPFAISLRWVEHLVTLDDPRAADSLWKRAVHGEWSPAIYDVVVGAGMNLSDKIAQQCEVAEIFGDTRGLLISLRSGHPGAIERLSRYSQSLKSAEGPVLKLMRERSPFDGENEDLDAWLKTNREQLVFSTEKQAYLLKGDVN
ncbi:MAG: hypothetical protein L7V86_11885, partial [Verrucomicrobiales bacterium]|nr:hypothetical protein [Verrucomicrobiales bacterium]